MADYDMIIRGGRVVDGTGRPSFVGDVAVTGGRVAKIDGLKRATADRELDARGLVVAPGVIDLHTHYDAQLFFDPYCTISGWHGVTSVVIGNCGFGFAPVRPEDRERAMLRMTRNEAIDYEVMASTMPWDWISFPEFLDSLERQRLGVNVTSLCPIAPIMLWVLGEDFLPAQVAGFDDRGAILPGLRADLIVYDLDTLRPDPDFDYDQAYDLPAGDWRRVQRAVGYRWTIVNGEVTFEDGQCTGAAPGQLVRQGR